MGTMSTTSFRRRVIYLLSGSIFCATLLLCASPAAQGASVATVAKRLARDTEQLATAQADLTETSKELTSVTYKVPSGTVAQLVTGLKPGTSYAVTESGGTVTVKPGTGTKADTGGVLVIGDLP